MVRERDEIPRFPAGFDYASIVGDVENTFLEGSLGCKPFSSQQDNLLRDGLLQGTILVPCPSQGGKHVSVRLRRS